MKDWNTLRWALIGSAAFLTLGLYIHSHWIGERDGEEEVAESTAVLVADRYIPALTIVKPGMVKPKKYPRGLVPPGALHALKQLSSTQGQGVFQSAVAIPQGQPVTRTLLSEMGRQHGMASLLVPGQVAVSFAVDPVRGAGGWVQPGDMIAIFAAASLRPENQLMPPVQLLFSCVRVLAVNHKRLGAVDTAKSIQDAPSEQSVLTVGMNPLEAARLVEAREKGRLSVLLRALGDEAPWPESHG